MASVRKKFNPAAGKQRIAALRQKNRDERRVQKLEMADAEIRKMLKGVMLSYNSTWEQDIREGEEGRQVVHTTGLEQLRDALKGDKEITFGACIEIVINWRVYLTIYNVTQDGEEYVILYPVIDRRDSIINIIAEIQGVIIPAELKKRNQAHIKDWGYWGEIV